MSTGICSSLLPDWMPRDQLPPTPLPHLCHDRLNPKTVSQKKQTCPPSATFFRHFVTLMGRETHQPSFPPPRDMVVPKASLTAHASLGVFPSSLTSDFLSIALPQLTLVGWLPSLFCLVPSLGHCHLSESLTITCRLSAAKSRLSRCLSPSAVHGSTWGTESRLSYCPSVLSVSRPKLIPSPLKLCLLFQNSSS